MVEEGRWRIERLGQIRVGATLFGPSSHPCHSHRGITDQTGQRHYLAGMVACGRAQQASPRRRGRRNDGCLNVRPVDVVSQEASQQVHRGDAVGQRMMHLADHGEPATGQPLGEMKLPQRAAAVQRCGHHLPDNLVQLSPAARRRHLTDRKW